MVRILLALFLIWLFVVGSLAISWPGGVRFFTTTTSSSMIPAIYPGSLIVTRTQSFDEYNPDDIITFYVSPTPRSKTDIVTHRIIRMAGNVYLTKGDANTSEDPSIVIPRHIIGKVVLVIPWVGNSISFAKTQMGMYLTIIIPACFFAVIELKRIYRYSTNFLIF